MPENQNDMNSGKNMSVLITGGSGLVGRYLTSTLLSKGYTVSHLSRKASQFGKVRIFRWDPEKQIIDPAVFDGIDYIVHLAGANIGEKRWTKYRKEEIVNSRIQSARLLHKVISGNRITLKAFISASAVGYYGSVTSERIFSENDPSSSGFLGTTCQKWEDGADLFEKSGIRTVKIRTAVVLEKSDSALSKLMMPAKYGFLIQTGNGHQYMPWIHIEDLCGIYLKAIEDSNISGAYNAVSPQHATHKDFMRVLSGVVKRPVLFPNVPGYLIKLLLGEMSDVILKGSRVSSVKIRDSGYSFLFEDLEIAIRQVLNINPALK
jgi:uncharacterized protein